MKRISELILAVASPFIFVGCAASAGGLSEVNTIESPPDDSVIAIVNTRLIDGRGGEPLPDAAVLVEGNRIAAVGQADELDIPDDAERIDAAGQTLLPGFIDVHLHSTMNNDLINRFLRNGVTTMRDPGHPFRFYQSLAFADQPVPRVFLCGAHLDGYPPAWPQQAVVVRDADHAVEAVHEHVDNGATAIKLYYGVPLEYYESIVAAAREREVPVIAHLELVDADDAIRAGVEGIEHITSFGTAIASPEVAERFKQAVRADSDARREGRFELWASVDLESERVQRVIDLVVERDAVVSPTIALFDRRGDDEAKPHHRAAFENMLAFTGMLYEAGATLVVGGHTWVPGEDLGWAFHREMEVLVEAGMSPMEAVEAGTIGGARYLRTQDRLGTIEPGKLADLVLVEDDPAVDIGDARNIQRVMLNGQWVRTSEE